MIEYRREIDGLRAVAVLPVILFHAGIDVFYGGFVGVDVFFVISGYLITSIIISEYKAARFSLIDFYERRARRILPALFFVMGVSIPCAWALLMPSDMRSFAESLVGVVFFASNILFWRESGYFDAAAELKPLLHTWSLAVEEQYYLLFPLFIMATWRLGRQWVVGLLVITLLTSLAAAHWGAYNKPAATFFLLPTRAWELAIGALIAFHLSKGRMSAMAGALQEALSALGIGLILFAIFFYDDTTPFPSVFTLVPTIGAALVILYATPTTLVGRLLGSRALVGVGLISYSAYLWHQPLFTFVRYGISDALQSWQMLLLAAAALILAFFTRKYIELPFKKGRRFSRSQVFLFSGACAALFLILGGIGIYTKGFERHYKSARLSHEERLRYELIKWNTGKNLYNEMFDDGECRFWSQVLDKNALARFERCAQKFDKALIVLGDSHAMNIYNILAKAGYYPFVLGLSQGGCRPHDNHPYCHYVAFDDFVKAQKQKISSVVFHQSGAYLLEDKKGEVGSGKIFDANAPFLLNRGNVEKIIDYLGGVASTVPTIWLGPFAEARVNFNDDRVLTQDLKIPEKSLQQFSSLEEALKLRMAEPDLGFRYISLADILKIDRDFILSGSCVTYNDVDHFSLCGEDLVARKFGLKLSESL